MYMHTTTINRAFKIWLVRAWQETNVLISTQKKRTEQINMGKSRGEYQMHWVFTNANTSWYSQGWLMTLRVKRAAGVKLNWKDFRHEGKVGWQFSRWWWQNFTYLTYSAQHSLPQKLFVLFSRNIFPVASITKRTRFCTGLRSQNSVFHELRLRRHVLRYTRACNFDKINTQSSIL